MEGAKREKRRYMSDVQLGYSFLTPALVFLFIFIAVPILYACYLSFFEWKLFDLGLKKSFVGLANYLKIFDDAVFLKSVFNTLIIVVVCLVLEIVLGFLIALAIWTLKRSMRLIQSIILLPMITSPVVVGLIWRYIYDPQFGILNYLLKKMLGISGMSWLGDKSLALFSVIVVDVWQMTPFVILILYAAMLTISEESIEAAQVDGAKFWLITRKIILPEIMPMVGFTMLIRVMDLFRIFDTIYVMTKGGPGYATETLALYTYKTGFIYYDMGYAMALSIITLLCIMGISFMFRRAGIGR